jgi:NAD(P)-dependent dehydrogenase (short-subunit alcohol dehydrogenase family)
MMTSATNPVSNQREPDLAGQTVVLTGRNPDRLGKAAAELGAQRTAAFDAKLEARRNELREKLPIGRVVGPADVAALAVHIMTNTAITGATYDIDGGQQFVSA